MTRPLLLGTRLRIRRGRAPVGRGLPARLVVVAVAEIVVAEEGSVVSVERTEVHVMLRTICFHPDTLGMMPMQEEARRLLTEAGLTVDSESRRGS